MDFLERQTLIFFGVTFGALITGAFSLISLIISKENKTSEFRQEWINALREEISNFLANLKQYTYLSCLGDIKSEKTQDNDKLNEKLDEYDLDFSIKRKEKIFESRIEIIKYYGLIKLRINNKDINLTHRELNNNFLSYLDDAYKNYNLKEFDTNSKYKVPYSDNSHPYLTTSELADTYIQLINNAAAPILKYEWERVKAGECWFKVAKYFSTILFISCIILLISISLPKETSSSKITNSTPEKQCVIDCPRKYIEMMNANKNH